jgi:hypothetical protein
MIELMIRYRDLRGQRTRRQRQVFEALLDPRSVSKEHWTQHGDEPLRRHGAATGSPVARRFDRVGRSHPREPVIRNSAHRRTSCRGTRRALHGAMEISERNAARLMIALSRDTGEDS